MFAIILDIKKPQPLDFSKDCGVYFLFATFTFLERTTNAISVDHTDKDLSTVFASYHVNHNFIRPAIFGLYLIQRAGGFFLKQFKAAICHMLADVFDTRQIISECVKSFSRPVSFHQYHFFGQTNQVYFLLPHLSFRKENAFIFHINFKRRFRYTNKFSSYWGSQIFINIPVQFMAHFAERHQHNVFRI